MLHQVRFSRRYNCRTAGKLRRQKAETCLQRSGSNHASDQSDEKAWAEKHRFSTGRNWWRLVELLLNAIDSEGLRFEPAALSEEGVESVDRIYARDPTVAQVLREKRWFEYVTEATKPLQQSILPQLRSIPQVLSDNDFETYEDAGGVAYGSKHY
ncbi:hypothetical protein L218DRAFT_996264 [Marasmius fiardii PR-910]|nr:hypothetical protein L218DRAFT_996264 [Marasmius fiardii PR-910]